MLREAGPLEQDGGAVRDRRYPRDADFHRLGARDARGKRKREGESNDTLTFEKRPPIVKEPKFQVFPVHMRLIADSGIYIIENLDLGALAKAEAYEFPVVVPPLKVKGGTGSALRAFALVPR